MREIVAATIKAAISLSQKASVGADVGTRKALQHYRRYVITAVKLAIVSEVAVEEATFSTSLTSAAHCSGGSMLDFCSVFISMPVENVQRRSA